MKLIFADSGYYKKELISYLSKMTDIALMIIRNIKNSTKGFFVRPFRWIVERTFAWFVHSRRLSKDYEYTFDSSENFIYIAMIRKMLRRLIITL